MLEILFLNVWTNLYFSDDKVPTPTIPCSLRKCGSWNVCPRWVRIVNGELKNIVTWVAQGEVGCFRGGLGNAIALEGTAKRARITRNRALLNSYNSSKHCPIKPDETDEIR